MMMNEDRRSPMHVPRREFLWRVGGGLGGIAMAYLLGQEQLVAEAPATAAALNGGVHHKAKVKRVVQLFMNGGVSPMDTFDPKPRLAELDGQAFDPGGNQLVESVT